jgi:hypothetical protein
VNFILYHLFKRAIERTNLNKELDSETIVLAGPEELTFNELMDGIESGLIQEVQIALTRRSCEFWRNSINTYCDENSTARLDP